MRTAATGFQQSSSKLYCYFYSAYQSPDEDVTGGGAVTAGGRPAFLPPVERRSRQESAAPVVQRDTHACPHTHTLFCSVAQGENKDGSHPSNDMLEQNGPPMG